MSTSCFSEFFPPLDTPAVHKGHRSCFMPLRWRRLSSYLGTPKKPRCQYKGKFESCGTP